jgi:hypothetical protein
MDTYFTVLTDAVNYFKEINSIDLETAQIGNLRGRAL